MRTFKSEAEAARNGLPPGIRRVVERCVRRIVEGAASTGGAWEPEKDGYVVLLDGFLDGYLDSPLDGGGDARGPLAVLGIPGVLAETPFEVVEFWPDGECFVCYYVANNSFCLTVIVPDGARLDPAARESLAAQAAASAFAAPTAEGGGEDE